MILLEFKISNFQANFNDGRSISCEMVRRWMSMDLTGDESTLVQVMAWCRQATSHYLNQCWLSYMTSYGVTRPQWVKIWVFPKIGSAQSIVRSLWPSKAIWRRRSGSTLAQIMVCWLTTPSYYLNQYQLLIGEVLWHSLESYFRVNAQAIILYSETQNGILKSLPYLQEAIS